MALSLLPPTTLPTVTATGAQVGRTRYCEGMASMFTNATPFTRIPPFVVVNSSSSTVSSVRLTPVADETDYVEIVSLLTFDYGNEGSQYFKAHDGASVINPANNVTAAVSGTMTLRAYVESYSGGPFYLRVLAGPSPQYTEWFHFEDLATGDTDNICNAIILEWHDSACSFNNLRYDLADIRNKIYLKADVGKPTYTYDEDGQEDGDKEVDPVFQKVRKVSRIECIVPEYLTDAFALLPLHDTVYLTDQFGDQYQIDNIEVSDPEWINGCLASVTIAYSIGGDYAIKRCC